MAKQRMIDTKFWDDNYTSNLDPIEKLLFLYCLTNTHTNICGIYEIPLKSIAADTGIDKDMALKILGRFENDRKIIYRHGWICILNFVKYQNQGSPKIKIGIEKEMQKVPKWLTDLAAIPYTYHMQALSHSNTNSNTNSKVESNDSSEEDDIGEKLKLTQELLRKTVGVNEFKEEDEMPIVSECHELMEKIGREEFLFRLEKILEDEFKAKNSNKLKYLFGELRSFRKLPNSCSVSGLEELLAGKPDSVKTKVRNEIKKRDKEKKPTSPGIIRNMIEEFSA